MNAWSRSAQGTRARHAARGSPRARSARRPPRPGRGEPARARLRAPGDRRSAAALGRMLLRRGIPDVTRHAPVAGPELRDVPPGLRQAQTAVRAPAHDVRVMLVLTVVLPEARITDLVVAPGREGEISAAGARTGLVPFGLDDAVVDDDVDVPFDPSVAFGLIPCAVLLGPRFTLRSSSESGALRTLRLISRDIPRAVRSSSAPSPIRGGAGLRAASLGEATVVHPCGKTPGPPPRRGDQGSGRIPSDPTQRVRRRHGRPIRGGSATSAPPTFTTTA